jgi:hypothetical protein
MSRAPAYEKRIADISDEDQYVTVIGTVIAQNPNDYTMTLDDGSGQTTIFGDRLLTIGSVARVIGKPFEGGAGINAEVIQDFSGINLGILHRIRTLEAML